MRKMPNEFLKGTAFELFVFLIFLSFTLYAFRTYMVGGVVGEDYICGGDGMAHVYKITELVARMKQRVYVDWTDAGGLGYHPYHFYSPLSYTLYACIAFLVNDVGLGMRIGVASSIGQTLQEKCSERIKESFLRGDGYISARLRAVGCSQLCACVNWPH